jgi:hypothetical protein
LSAISNHDLEAKWAAYGAFSDAIGYSYMLDGHPMYVVSFPTGGESWLYDGSTNGWTQLVSNGSRGTAPSSHVNYLGRNYVTDYSTARSTAFSDSVHRQRRPDPLGIAGGTSSTASTRSASTPSSSTSRPASGLATGQGSDPQVMLRVSRDGGRTWGNERWRSIGKIGEYKKRVLWGKVRPRARFRVRGLRHRPGEDGDSRCGYPAACG